jgi:hypothetical protein
MERMAKEGYAVFVGDGDEGKDDKKDVGRPAGVLEKLGLKPDAEAGAERAGSGSGSGSEAGSSQSGGPAGGKKKKKSKKKKGGRPIGSEVESTAREAQAATARAGAKATGPRMDSLDYSRFAAIEDEEGEDHDLDEALGAVGGADPSTVPPEFAAQLAELEKNPLWATILSIAGGDGAKALELMKDPDSLQTRPEIAALFSGENMGDDEGGDEGDDGDDVDE